MTTIELLKPRYKVIAPYPHCPYMIGDLLRSNEEEAHLTTTSYRDSGELHDVNNYFPWNIVNVLQHLFKKLEWWQERKPEEMPEYVKYTVSGEIANYRNHLKDGRIVVGEYGWSLKFCLPATEEEYNNQTPKP